jgi:hypothetical protein
LGDDPDVSAIEVREDEGTVGVSDAGTTIASSPVNGVPDRQTNAVSAPIVAQKGAIAQRGEERHTTGAPPSKIETSTSRAPERATNADPLAAEVSGLGFDSPAEEASAMAALATIQDPKHRDVLLRTMKASLAMRSEQSAPPDAIAESAVTSAPAVSRSATATDQVDGATDYGGFDRLTADERPAPQKNIVPAAQASATQSAASRRSADSVRQVDHRDSRTDIKAELNEAEDTLAGGWRNHLNHAISGLET